MNALREVGFVRRSDLLAENLKMNDIVDTTLVVRVFKTLLSAVQAAGLIDTLKGIGPFTEFAPTFDGFGKLPASATADLLKPASLLFSISLWFSGGEFKACSWAFRFHQY